MRSQLGFARHTAEVNAYHFKGPKHWLSSYPKTNQQPCYDRTVSLNLNAMDAVAQKMSAAEHMPEEAKKYFNCPSFGVDERDDLRTIAVNS